jgi:hypothetical protein
MVRAQPPVSANEHAVAMATFKAVNAMYSLKTCMGETAHYAAYMKRKTGHGIEDRKAAKRDIAAAAPTAPAPAAAAARAPDTQPPLPPPIDDDEYAKAALDVYDRKRARYARK